MVPSSDDQNIILRHKSKSKSSFERDLRSKTSREMVDNKMSIGKFKNHPPKIDRQTMQVEKSKIISNLLSSLSLRASFDRIPDINGTPHSVQKRKMKKSKSLGDLAINLKESKSTSNCHFDLRNYFHSPNTKLNKDAKENKICDDERNNRRNRRVSILDWLKDDNHSPLNNKDDFKNVVSKRDSDNSLDNESTLKKEENKAWKFASKPVSILNMKNLMIRDDSSSSTNSLNDPKEKQEDLEFSYSPSPPRMLNDLSPRLSIDSSNQSDSHQDDINPYNETIRQYDESPRQYDESPRQYDESPRQYDEFPRHYFRSVDFPNLQYSDSSSSFHHDDSNSSFMQDEDTYLIESPRMIYSISNESKEKVIHATTLQAIIEEITSTTRNKSLLNDFINCLPFIASPLDILQALEDRFKNPIRNTSDYSPKEVETINFNIQKHVLALLQDWIDTNFKYFLDPRVLSSLYKFLKYSLRESNSSGSTSISKSSKSRRTSSSLARTIFTPLSDVMISQIQIKFAFMDPRNLAPIALRMKNSKGGIRTFKKIVPVTQKDGTTVQEEFDVFLGSDALKWMRKIHDESLTSFNESYRRKEQNLSTIQHILDLDYTEVLNHLLKNGLISSLARSKNVESNYVLKKNRKYIFSISRENEDSTTLRYARLSDNLFRCKEDILQVREKKFTMIDPDIFAQHLSFFELNLFKKIETHELHYWMKGDKHDAKRKRIAPNLYHMISFVNHMSLWISTEIVSENDPFTRASIIKKFLMIAEKCLLYKNYQGLLEISLGLTSSSVQRLSAWRDLEKEYIEIYSKISDIMSPMKNWKNYREQIENIGEEPCVPYIGLYLSDLTFIQDGIPTNTKDGMINWKKISKIKVIMDKIHRIQKHEYDFKIEDNVLRFITEETVKVDEKTLHEISVSLEKNRGRSNSIF